MAAAQNNGRGFAGQWQKENSCKNGNRFLRNTSVSSRFRETVIEGKRRHGRNGSFFRKKRAEEGEGEFEGERETLSRQQRGSLSPSRYTR